MKETMFPLFEIFCVHWAGEITPKVPEASILENILTELINQAQNCWPEISLTNEDFLSFVAERMPKVENVQEELRHLPASDLYLAKACINKNQKALDVFGKMLKQRLVQSARRHGVKEADCDDLMQDMFERILLGTTKSPPILQNYTGRGPLVGWLRVVVTRMTMKAKVKQKPWVSVEDQLEAQIGLDGEDKTDPELAYVKARHLSEFRKAFRSAFSELEPRDKNVLRYSVEQQLNIDQIGRIYRVHRATVARWLVSIRIELLKKTQAHLFVDSDTERVDIASIFRIIESRLDVSLNSHCGSLSSFSPLNMSHG